MNMVSKKIFEMSGEGIKDLEVKGSCKFVLENGEKIEILLEQVEISFGEIKGKAVATNEFFTIALETGLDEELLSEGVSREFINKIQNEIKNIDLNITDKIKIEIKKSSSFVFDSLVKHKDFICNETQALEYVIKDEINSSNKIDFELDRNMERESIYFKIVKE